MKDIYILAIESSAVAASAAVLSDGALLSEEFSQNGLTHSVTLLPMVESALEKAKLDINDIDYEEEDLDYYIYYFSEGGAEEIEVVEDVG